MSRHLDRAWVHPVTRGYFDALGIDFQEGRGFGPEDRSDGTIPIVVNAQAARELFGTAPGAGAAVRFASLEARVVGVIDDVRHWGADQPLEPEFYLPYDPRGAWASGLSFVARAEALPPMESLRSTVSQVAPRAIVDDVQPMSSVLRESRARHRFYTLVLSIFAGCALLLAAAGLAGTLLYDTWLRRRELGIRMALGAPSGGLIRRLVLRAMALATVGGAVGAAIYWPLRTRLDAVVPGVDPANPVVLAALVVVLAGAALAAAGLPARLVAGMDPARTLRP